MLLATTPPASSWYPAWEEVAVLVGLGVAYVLAARKDRPPLLRSALFFSGLVLAFVAVASPVATVAVHYLLSAHLLQNVVLAEWTPALLVLGLGPWVAGWVARTSAARTLTRPLVALPLWALNLYFWHLSALYNGVLDSSVPNDLPS